VPMKNKNIFYIERGFTLVEVLLSITILGIIFLSILALFNNTYDYSKRNESKTVGINVARNVLNYIENQDFNTIKHTYFATNGGTEEIKITRSSCNKSPFPADSCGNMLKTVVNNVTFEATVTLKKHPEAALQNYLIPVEVKIKWNDRETSVEGVLKK
jgi:prepilin-type N-terminal cleavage/methylation domain-containing protein